MLSTILQYGLPSFLLVLGGIAGYFIQNRINKLQKIEENIRNEKFELYKKLLSPYLHLLSFPDDEVSIEMATNELLSYPYKVNYYNLRFVGNDKIIRLHNKLMEMGYNARRSNDVKISKEEKKVLINTIGELFLEIRKEYGVKTKLKPNEIVEFALKELNDSIDWSNPPF